MNDYTAFLERKAQSGADHGFEPTWLPDCLFDFQRALVEWSVRKGTFPARCMSPACHQAESGHHRTVAPRFD